MTPHSRAGHLAMLAFSALVAGSFSLGALAANEIAPAALNVVRFVIAGAVIAGIALATTGIPAASLRAPWRYGVLGVLFAFYLVMMFEGLKTAPAVGTSAVFTLTPLMAAGFGWILVGQRPTGRILGALAIGAVGALWVIFRADLAALLAFDIGRGEGIFFWGCLAHAIYTPMVRRLNRGENPVVFTLWTIVAGGLVLALWGWRDIVATGWGGLPAIVWVTILYTAIFATAATFVLLQFAALRLPSSKVMAYTYLTPAWVTLWQFALTGALAPPMVLIGVLLTCLALWLLLRD